MEPLLGGGVKFHMKQRNSRHRRGGLPCVSMEIDDGIDARDLFRKSVRKKSNHKAHQLCKQVMETINILLAGGLGDARLHQILVDSVTPAPDSTRLRISVRPMDSNSEYGLSEIQAALNEAHGLIRCEVAAAVQRKKTPELVFLVVPEERGSHE